MLTFLAKIQISMKYWNRSKHISRNKRRVLVSGQRDLWSASLDEMVGQVDKAAEIKSLSKKDPVPLDMLLRSNLAQQELSRMNINSLSFLDKTVHVTTQVMRMLGGLLER